MNNRALRRAGEIAGGSSGPDAPGRSKAVLDEHLFTELSRTNNELVNLQREMARRNAQLAVAQRQLQASEHRYLNLSACSPLGILEMDAKGLCLYSNPRWQADTGFEPEESLGEGWRRALDGRDAPAFLEEWKAKRDLDEEFERQSRLATKEGRQRWAQIRSRCIRGPGGVIVGHVFTVVDITAGKQAEAALEKAHQELLEVSRRAGMAEIATGVLHNVGNVLNSVNVSANVLCEAVRTMPVSDLDRVVALLLAQGPGIGTFFSHDPRGPKATQFLSRLVESFTATRGAQLEEVALLQKNLDHIKDIVAMQQSYARVCGVTETLQVTELVEDTLRIHAAGFQRHAVEVVREFAADLPAITTERPKVLQILVNLISNAKAACDESLHDQKRIIVRAAHCGGKVRVEVIDNGVGIAPENMARIFNHGFTTKKDGHGFGLHNSANVAKELGGKLTAQSEGVGKGAAFLLELPVARREDEKRTVCS